MTFQRSCAGSVEPLGIAPIDGDRTEEQASEPAVSRAKVDPITGVSDEVDRS